MLLVEMMKHFCDKICILYNKFTVKGKRDCEKGA